MQELFFKNYLKALFILIVGVVLASGAAYFEFGLIGIPMPVYILGLAAGFLVISFISYPKATIGQSLQIAISGILINAISLYGVYFANNFLELPPISLKPGFILDLDPTIVVVTFVFAVITLAVMISFEQIELESQEEAALGSNVITPPPVEDEKIALPEEENVKVREIEDSTPVSAPTEYESLYPEAAKYTHAEKEPVKDEIDLQAESEVSEEMDLMLEDDEEATLHDEYMSLEPETTEEQPKEQAVSPKLTDDSDNEVDSQDFIPLNIRLSEGKQEKLVENTGKIGSIGKLIINNRDIENIIESTESSEGRGENSRTNIISSVSGEEIYKKFSELKKEFTYIREVALIDKGGFVLANDFEDKQRVQITGALVAGSYHTLQNYLAQISMQTPTGIFFETAESNSFILKTGEQILFSSWDKDFKHIEYGPLVEIVEKEDFSGLDLRPYADLMNIKLFTIAGSDGALINSIGDTEAEQKFAAVATAIFENLKVFLMNIQLLKLSKIVVFTPYNVMTIIKTGDKIISMRTDAENYPKISDELLKMEEIY